MTDQETASTDIQRVEVYGYDVTYVHGTYVMSGGRRITSLPSTIVRVVTAGGIDGFGASTASASYRAALASESRST